MVSAVPFTSGSAFCATRVENKGESATTMIPQNRRKAIKISTEFILKKRGEARQQIPESANAEIAVFLVQFFSAINPPKTQANPPTPIIKNDHSENLKLVW